MPVGLRVLFGVVALIAATVAGSSAPQTPSSLADLLTRYEAGNHNVALIAARTTDFAAVRRELDLAVPAWMRADVARSAERRRAVAATFALEVAREGFETMRRQSQEWVAGGARGGRGGPAGHPGFAQVWSDLRLLIEWGCALIRAAPVPSPSEKLWALASLAIAARRADRPFIVGPPPGTSETQLAELREQYGASLGHGLHVPARLMSDPQIALVLLEARYGTGGAAYLVSRRLEFTPGQFAAIQREAAAIVARRNQPGLRIFDASGRSVSFRPSATDSETLRLADLLAHLRDMGREIAALNPSGNARAEAQVQLGVIALCFADREAALKSFGDAEQHALTAYDRYLSSYLQGRIHDLQNRAAEAEASYRRALDAVPRAQSGVTVLARLLFLDGRRSEASSLVAAMHASPSAVVDPWVQFLEGRDRWPDLIAPLRETLK